MSNFEKKFGKYAIPNISLILILCYVAGYIIDLVNPSFMDFLTLDPYRILHGQVWRILTWIIQPPANLSFFTVIMLLFYYNIGTSLERAWGTYRYNVYLLGGILLTVLASFLCLGAFWIYTGGNAEQISVLFSFGARLYSTYYINMSIFLAYAATFPEHQVLLMFVIPIKVKWLGIVYAVMLLLDMGQYYVYVGMAPYLWFAIVAIASSLLNFGIFWLRSRNLSYLRPKEVKRRAEFKQKVRQGNSASHIHKCAVCGRTSESDPTLEFRYCSKCNGNYEYCQDHLFTHEHVK